MSRSVTTSVFIIHGTKGSPNINWFPWLKRELEGRECSVFALSFPTPEGQNLDAWMEILFKHERDINDRTIFVAHSLGPAFVLNVLETLDHPIKAAFFVAGFTGLLGIPEFDNLNKTFCDKPFDWNKIRSNCKRFVVINSDNDPFVPLEKGRYLAEQLGVPLITIKNAGHLNQDAGFTNFSMLLDLIKKEI
jgi:uncharacterized protein